MSSRCRSTFRIWICAASALALVAACPAATAQAPSGDPSAPAPAVRATPPKTNQKKTDPAQVAAQAAKVQKKNPPGNAGKTAAAGNKESSSLDTLKKKLEDKQAELDAKSSKLDDTLGNLDKKTKQLDDATKQLKAANDKLAQLSQHGLAGRLSWLAPAAAALLSLFAILWVVYERRRMKTLLEDKTPSKELLTRLEEAEKELEERQEKEKAAGSQYPAPNRAAASSQTSKRGNTLSADKNFGTVTASTSALPRKFSDEAQALAASKAGAMHASADSGSSQPDPPPPPPANLPPAPPRPTGDIVGDYNTARSMGNDGPDWFKNAYTHWVGLSCTNTSDLLVNPKAVPLFELQDQGSYLGVSHNGETRLVPALGWDLAALAPNMKGIFETPSAAGSLLLQKEALIEQNGNLWKLNAKGVIGLG